MRELLRIETERLLLSWSAVRAEEPLPGDAPPPCRIEVRPRREGMRCRVQPATCPGGALTLREQTDYLLFLRSCTDQPVEVVHRDPVLLRDLACSDNGRVVHGRINFGSQIGRTLLSFQVAGEPELDLELEVLPTKLDYAEDYARLVEDTQEILAGLVLEHLRSTFQPGRPTGVPQPSRLEWLTLLRHAADELERALTQIARRPQRALTRDPQQTRAERVQRADASLRRGVLRGAGAGRTLPLRQGLPVRERLEERRARPTLDTPEHRWLAARLAEVRHRLARLRQAEQLLPGSARLRRTLEEITALEERIVRLSQLEPLAAAAGAPPPGFASLPLQILPGYAEAYRACLLLSQGLRLEGGPVDLALKDLHLLYEYWCFLTLLRLLGAVLGQQMAPRELLVVEQQGLRVRLQRGQTHAVGFAAPDGRRVALTYNPRFTAEPLLVPQQPDFLLEIQEPGGAARLLVLDAKYRLDASPAYLARHGVPGPPEEALNDLHRYRDAIRLPGAAGSRRVVTQAVALFPYREDEPGRFRGSRLSRSLECIGVGALPLLPGSTEYLEEWLRAVISARGA